MWEQAMGHVSDFTSTSIFYIPLQWNQELLRTLGGKLEDIGQKKKKK